MKKQPNVAGANAKGGLKKTQLESEEEEEEEEEESE